MKNCKKCGKSFLSYIKINNVIRQSSGRVFCYDCSPFGQHNTKSLDKLENTIILLTDKKICSRCKLTKTRADFFARRGKKGHAVWCKSCIAEYTKNRARDFKLECISYLGGKCELCGYNKCPDALDFHHKDSSQKDFAISAGVRKFTKQIKLELDKCQLLCANCHRELHYLSNRCTPGEI